MFLFTELAFDIEEIITKELDVLLTFRKSTKQFKDLLEQNKNNFKRMENRHSRGFEWSQSNKYLRMVTSGTQRRISMKDSQLNPSIYGFNFISQITRLWDNRPTHHGELQVTAAQLNDKLTELGAKKFKSKSKTEKINLLMSDGKYHRRYALTN